AGEEPASECRQVVCLVLEDAEERLAQREILEEWPEDFRKPDLGTLSRTLGRCVEQEQVRRQGTGRKNDPYRYWLPGKEGSFFPGRNAPADVLQRWQQHNIARLNRLWRVDVEAGANVPAAARGENPDAGPMSACDEQSPPPGSEPALAFPQDVAAAPPATRPIDPEVASPPSSPASAGTP